MSGPDKPVLSEQQLLEALWHAQEIMERCLFPFVLLGETARSIVEDKAIKGDKITFGVRRADALTHYTNTLSTLASNIDFHVGIQDYRQTPEGFFWTFKGIPIEIKVIHNKYNYFDNPDQVYFWGETLKIPNPFSKYYSMRNLIK